MKVKKLSRLTQTPSKGEAFKKFFFACLIGEGLGGVIKRKSICCRANAFGVYNI